MNGYRQYFKCRQSFLLVVIFDILILMRYNSIVVNQLVIRVLLPDKQMFKGIMKNHKNLFMNDKNIHINFVIVFCVIFMKGGSFYIQSHFILY